MIGSDIHVWLQTFHREIYNNFHNKTYSLVFDICSLLFMNPVK